MINKSATKVGTVEFDNGNRTTLWVGGNSNTGATIMWQQLEGQRASRVTGGNIRRLMDELDECLATGEAFWTGPVNDAALRAISA